jgi:hypothetical protein
LKRLAITQLVQAREPSSTPTFRQRTAARVSFFMNRFRNLGFIEYNGRIRVHRSLLNVILHD